MKEAPSECSDKLMLNAAGGTISWDKGKGSEVSVMLTVSAAAAKVSKAAQKITYLMYVLNG